MIGNEVLNRPEGDGAGPCNLSSLLHASSPQTAPLFNLGRGNIGLPIFGFFWVLFKLEAPSVPGHICSESPPSLHFICHCQWEVTPASVHSVILSERSGCWGQVARLQAAFILKKWPRKNYLAWAILGEKEEKRILRI